MMKHLSSILFFVVFTVILTGNISMAAVAEKESSSSLDQYFQKAREDYLKKDLNSAATEIHKGASYLKSEATKATGKGKEVLTASADELEKLAESVKKGTVKSVETLETSFARANNAMAENYFTRATESWADKEMKKAGEALDKSLMHLKLGLAWSGKKIEKATNETLKKSKELSQKLKNKATLIADDVAKGFKATGDEIEKLGKKISPSNNK